MSCTPHPVPLLSDPPVHLSGFAPRGLHRITLQRPPCTDVKLELMTRLRRPLAAEQPPPPTRGFLTWLEVSRLPPLLSLRQDRPHNSDIWRRISVTAAGAGDVIPPPSRMEENTWDKYVRCSRLQRSEADTRTLRILSQGRAPPTDRHGNILPPEGFRRYTAPGITAAVGSEMTLVPVNSGLYSAPQFPHTPRKLTLKNQSPKYQEILQKYRELQRGARSVAPYNSRLTTPRTATQGARAEPPT
ncbi:testis-expressed protein 52 [Dendropsophus ebraccatus]|uniref:testis-expressed protein 52 n=1 Tax=Dendropsophus ebraccatus TaxID=150705 RepID=UPI003831553E